MSVGAPNADILLINLSSNIRQLIGQLYCIIMYVVSLCVSEDVMHDDGCYDVLNQYGNDIYNICI